MRTMSDLKLFELANEFRALEALAESDDIPSEVIADTLEGLEGDFDSKAVAVAKFVLSLEAHADAINAAAATMDARAKRVYNRADSIRAYLLFNLQSVDRKRIETAELVIRRVTNPPAVQITDEAAIPRAYWVQPPPPPERIDRKAIAAALKAGERVSGAFLESGERVEIKL